MDHVGWWLGYLLVLWEWTGPGNLGLPWPVLQGDLGVRRSRCQDGQHLGNGADYGNTRPRHLSTGDLVDAENAMKYPLLGQN